MLLAQVAHLLGLSLDYLAQTTTADPPRERRPSYDYGIPSHAVHKKRQTEGIIVTTGVHTGTGPNGSLPLRYEIRHLQQDAVTWTLYILGLDMLQYTDQSETLSWYMLSSIHGRPFVPFNGVQANFGNQNSGYCQHVSILFPTWHRPYLALYEQTMYDLIQDIASMYSGSTRKIYMAAATNFRIPYWDWAARPSNESVFPRSLGSSLTVEVDGPAGLQTIANPLYSYRFRPLSASDLPDCPFDEFLESLRSPTANNSSARSQNNVVADRVDNNAASIRSRIYTLLTNYHDYTQFSNERWIATAPSAAQDSLESVHDQIHGLIGNGGHMTYIYYAAFDPVFWLHHAMLDRVFAMWQILNPDSFVVPQRAKYTSFTTTAGDIQDIDTPLTPFYKNLSGSFWTSADVVETATFGYSYPETADGMANNVIMATNTLYGPNVVSTTPKRDIFERGRSYREWIANIRVAKHALNGPFFIYIFLGSFSSDSLFWSDDPGSHTFFAKSEASTDHDPSDLVTATIPLTHTLVAHIDRGDLKSLETEDVNAYIAGKLKYTVALLNDVVVPNSAVPSLKISIVSAEVMVPHDASKLPVWGEMQGQIDVSYG